MYLKIIHLFSNRCEPFGPCWLSVSPGNDGKPRAAGLLSWASVPAGGTSSGPVCSLSVNAQAPGPAERMGLTLMEISVGTDRVAGTGVRTIAGMHPRTGTRTDPELHRCMKSQYPRRAGTPTPTWHDRDPYRTMNLRAATDTGAGTLGHFRPAPPISESGYEAGMILSCARGPRAPLKRTESPPSIRHPVERASHRTWFCCDHPPGFEQT